MEKRLIKIGEAAALLGSTPGQLRKWEKSGELLPARKTQGGTRYYSFAELLGRSETGADSEPLTVCYARVWSRDKEADLDRQQADLEAHCAAQGWRPMVIRDVGSGVNYHNEGLRKLLELIWRGRVRRLVITHRDRLLRFGAELVFILCKLQDIEIVNLDQDEWPDFEDELVQDLLEMVAVFSGRLYGYQRREQLLQVEQLLGALSEDGVAALMEAASCIYEWGDHVDDETRNLFGTTIEEARAFFRSRAKAHRKRLYGTR